MKELVHFLPVVAGAIMCFYLGATFCEVFDIYGNEKKAKEYEKYKAVIEAYERLGEDGYIIIDSRSGNETSFSTYHPETVEQKQTANPIKYGIKSDYVRSKDINQ